MVAGYVRLSRDDDGKNYSSIENQKLIICQHAAALGMEIDRWYEDDGITGYRFDRPGFLRLMDGLNTDIDTIYVKDFSRIGRHNAKVLLLLDELKERGIRLIAVDDQYDSASLEDDIIGIKTWYNERYVKDISRKIRRSLHARQKDGSLQVRVPFGYRRNSDGSIEPVPDEAAVIQKIYSLYLTGMGYRKIALYLTKLHIPTPSAMLHDKELSGGKLSRHAVAPVWTDGMVRDILNNDFYSGMFRLHKRARNTVHGADLRVPKEEQYLFEHHHTPIIQPELFSLVQSIKKERARTSYRGFHPSPNRAGKPSAFGTCLFCSGCRKRLTPVQRNTSRKKKRYYICSTYNSRGKSFCSSSHLIREQQLMETMIHVLQCIRDACRESLSSLSLPEQEYSGKELEQARLLSEQLKQARLELLSATEQYVHDLSAHPEQKELLSECHEKLQEQIFRRIQSLQEQLKPQVEPKQQGQLKPLPPSKRMETPELSAVQANAPTCRPVSLLEILDQLLERKELLREEAELLVERIEVDELGMPRIRLRFCIGPAAVPILSRTLNQQEGQLLSVIRELSGGILPPPSPSALSRKLSQAGYPITKAGVLPYLRLFNEAVPNLHCSSSNRRDAPDGL